MQPRVEAAIAQSTTRDRRAGDFAPLTLEVASTLFASPSSIPAAALLPARNPSAETTSTAVPSPRGAGGATAVVELAAPLDNSASAPHEPLPYGAPHGLARPSLLEALRAEEARAGAGGGGEEGADAATLLHRLQNLQACAEAAGRVEPLLRSPKHLRALCRYVRAAAPFTDLPDAALTNVARSIVMLRTAAGERVVREGDAGSAFFVVLAGTFAVYQRHATNSPYDTCAPPLRARRSFWNSVRSTRPAHVSASAQGARAPWRTRQRATAWAHLRRARPPAARPAQRHRGAGERGRRAPAAPRWPRLPRHLRRSRPPARPGQGAAAPSRYRHCYVLRRDVVSCAGCAPAQANSQTWASRSCRSCGRGPCCESSSPR